MPAQNYPLTIENQAFAYCRAHYYCRRFCVPEQLREDVQQEAVMATLVAETRFDPKHGVKFITYAGHWIDRQIKRFLMKHRTTVRFPSAVARNPEAGNGQFNPTVESMTRNADETPVEYTLPALVEQPDDPEGVRWYDIQNCLNYVDQRAQQILLERAFGRSLTAIGNDMNLSRERVRQIYNEALRNIRDFA